MLTRAATIFNLHVNTYFIDHISIKQAQVISKFFSVSVGHLLKTGLTVCGILT